MHNIQWIMTMQNDQNFTDRKNPHFLCVMKRTNPLNERVEISKTQNEWNERFTRKVAIRRRFIFTHSDHFRSFQIISNHFRSFQFILLISIHPSKAATGLHVQRRYLGTILAHWGGGSNELGFFLLFSRFTLRNRKNKKKKKKKSETLPKHLFFVFCAFFTE